MFSNQMRFLKREALGHWAAGIGAGCGHLEKRMAAVLPPTFRIFPILRFACAAGLLALGAGTACATLSPSLELPIRSTSEPPIQTQQNTPLSNTR